jgi:hypothetical protein
MRKAFAIPLAFVCSVAAQAQADPVPPLPEPDAGAVSMAPTSTAPTGSTLAPVSATRAQNTAVGQATASAPAVAAPHGAPVADPIRAPPYSLWVGGRAGVLAYGGSLYVDPGGGLETTGNFVTPGLGLEADVGARLATHYIPYLVVEIGVVGAGRRFDGENAKADTTFFGGGFRYVVGNIHSMALAGEISLGFRRFDLTEAAADWSATGFEILRLGLGIEVRLTRNLTLSPMTTVSGGTLTGTQGNVAFGPNQRDGLTGPPYANGAAIPGSAQQSYYAVVIGCGLHADLLGR